MRRTSRFKSSEEREVVNTINHVYLTDIYRTFTPRTLVFLFFITTLEISSRTERELSHKLISMNYKI